MSTSSANDTALPDRRSFLSTFTAAGALGIGAGLPGACAAASHPDAGLIELGALLTEAKALEAVLEARCEEAYEGFEPPPMPDALFWRERDFPGVWTNPLHLDSIGHEGSERYTYVSDGVLDTLRAQLAKWKATPKPIDRNCSDSDVARVEEIIACIEIWKVEEARQREACGYAAAEEASTAQAAIVTGLIEQIAMTPALTSEGVRVKVRAAATLEDPHWRFARILAEPQRRWDQTKEFLLVSAMVDVENLDAPATSNARSAA